MTKAFFPALACVLLTTTRAAPLPHRASAQSSSGAFGSYTRIPAFEGEAYSIEVCFNSFAADTHYLSLGWQSENATETVSVKLGRSFTNAYFPIIDYRVNAVAGDTTAFSFFVPGKYVAESNTMILVDYDVLDQRTYVRTEWFRTSSHINKAKDIASEGKIYGNNYVDYDYFGRMKNRTDVTEASALEEAYSADARQVIPFDRMRFRFYNFYGGDYREPEDDSLRLTISGEHAADFLPYVNHGATYSKRDKKITIPLRWKDAGDGSYYPIAHENVAGYDLGDGIRPYSEMIRLPKNKGTYPTYDCLLQNTESEVGSYYCSFRLDSNLDYFGSCRNAQWCVEVS